jgi:hypothetical protein
MESRRFVFAFAVLAFLSAMLLAQAPAQAPRIWDHAALADWATPIAALNVRPAHYSAAEYYNVPGDNLRTYPVYHPDSEPPNYWEELQKKKPEPLVDVSTIRTRQDWIAAGERAFFEVDSFWVRNNDPALIAQARDVRSFAGVPKEPDGTISGPLWVRDAKRCHAVLQGMWQLPRGPPTRTCGHRPAGGHGSRAATTSARWPASIESPVSSGGAAVLRR